MQKFGFLAVLLNGASSINLLPKLKHAIAIAATAFD